ncbi:MAG: FAD-dependent oxidoreductase [Taibaiella sp.]|nr:FAD-dependent oxidoreductase [Taibaiella sp.]
MKVDHLIVGQGLCGSLLSRELLRAGRSVLVIDDGAIDASSRVAGGLVNPVTGKRLVRSWMTEKLLPHAEHSYNEIGEELNEQLVKRTSILDFFPTHDAATLFMERVTEDAEYLSGRQNEEQWRDFFRFNYGIGVISPALAIDLGKFLDGWRDKLVERNALIKSKFQVEELIVTTTAVRYRDIESADVIFCDGASAKSNKWFGGLPWSDDKGEALIISVPGLPRDHIYKQGLSIVPWKDDLFWVGASHDWKNPQPGISDTFREATKERLDYWLRLPYTIEAHISALRPANFDRKPFVGFHPIVKNVGIFNGMGGKGISMAPWFAGEFAAHTTEGNLISPEVDVARYKKILERSLS